MSGLARLAAIDKERAELIASLTLTLETSRGVLQISCSGGNGYITISRKFEQQLQPIEAWIKADELDFVIDALTRLKS